MPPFSEVLRQVIQNQTLEKAVLSRPAKSSQGPYRKAVIRPITIQGKAVYQFAMQVDTQEIHQNLSGDETLARIDEWCPAQFTDCHLYTATDEVSVRFRKDGTPTIKRTTISRAASKPDGHDRSKAYLIPDGTPCPFLVETGVMTEQGSVRPSKQKKFRQVNRFLELVNDIVPSLPTDTPVTVIDFGCGKSSLTFALHHLLTEIHGLAVTIIGLDTKASVVVTCNELTQKLNLNGLVFRHQAIADLAEEDGPNPVDLVVSLHACDTATDDAITQAVHRQAKVILAVPCCQHEVRKSMSDGGLPSITRHGILKERLAAIATDALRADLLEQQGYRTQVVEFIDMEHTAKNLLIRAVRRPDGQPGTDRSKDIQTLKDALGISGVQLERALAKEQVSRIPPNRSSTV